MDTCNDDPPGLVVLQKSWSTEEKHSTVLDALENNNFVQANGKFQTKEITSRYELGIMPSPRPSSPSATQTSSLPRTLVPQRVQSADRRRPSTTPSSPSSPASPSTPSSWHSAPPSPPTRPSPPSTPSSQASLLSSPSSRPSTVSSTSQRPTTPVRDSTAERLTFTRRSLVGRALDGLWPSIRGRSASFQSEPSPVLSINMAVRSPTPDRSLKPSLNALSERKRTLFRGRNASDQSENSRPVENSHARVIEQLRWPAMIGGKVSSNVLSLKSLDLTDEVNRLVSSPSSAQGVSPVRQLHLSDSSSRILHKSIGEAEQLVTSDVKEKVTHVTSLNQSVDSLSSESSRQSRSPSPITHSIPSLSPKKALPTLSSISRGMQSPTWRRSLTPFSSPSSTYRGMHSPSLTRPSTPCSPLSNATTEVDFSSLVLNYFGDVQKGKNTNNEEAHQLRLLSNRHLQWCFVNARADVAFSTQKLIAKDVLYDICNITSELHDSLVVKRINVQNLREEVQLNTILKEQIAYLEDWSDLETEHSTSLSGTIEALKACTLRLPVTERARADVRAVKNAVSSAVDVMQVMGSCICHLLSRVEGTNCLVSELSEVESRERAMLYECRELLASTAAMQVQECSLRANLIQLSQDVLVE